jgi:hypothetical protein
MMRATTGGAAVLLAGAMFTMPAAAQRPTIEIRGQVPTPQIVTVRPREVPEFARQVLVPAFYNHQFWPVILPAYQIVNRSDVYGVMATDSMPPVVGAPVPVAGAPAVIPPPAPVRAPADTGRAAVDTAAVPAGVARPAVPPSTETEEMQALRRELEARRARLDSIEAIRKRQLDSLEQAIRERQQRTRTRVDSLVRPDSTVRPPGTSPAPSR